MSIEHEDYGGVAEFDWKTARYEAAESELRKLVAEREADRQDLARYRYMRDNCDTTLTFKNGGGREIRHMLRGRSLDEAVDWAAYLASPASPTFARD